MIDEWTDEEDDTFYDAIDALEEAGWLRVVNGVGEDDEDVLYSMAASERSPALDVDAFVEEALEEAPAAPVVLPPPPPPPSPPPPSPTPSPQSDYDVAAEAAAADAVLRAVAPLKRFGVDKEDAELVPALYEAVSQLTILMDKSNDPPLRDDPRLIGDWQLIGTTSKDVAERKGLTGLGAAPFTAPTDIFYRHGPDGTIVAKEILEFFGRPVIVNELRGKFGFDEEGVWMQEQYASADLSGVQNSPQFTSATATTRCVGVTVDGVLRVQFANGAFFVYRSLAEGELEDWLRERRLPYFGGTVATLDADAMNRAYPYLAEDAKDGAKAVEGLFKMPELPKMPKMPWDSE